MSCTQYSLRLLFFVHPSSLCHSLLQVIGFNHSVYRTPKPRPHIFLLSSRCAIGYPVAVSWKRGWGWGGVTLTVFDTQSHTWPWQSGEASKGKLSSSFYRGRNWGWEVEGCFCGHPSMGGEGLEHMTLDLSPLFFPFTPCTETRHAQKQSCILFIKPEHLNRSCATESFRMLLKNRGGQILPHT